MIAHERDRILAAQKDRIDVDCHDFLEHLIVFVFNATERANPGIVDQDVEAAHRIVGLLHDCLPALTISHVMLPGKGGAVAKFGINLSGDSILSALAINIRDGNFRALAREHFCGGFPKALSPACNDGFLT